MRVHLQYGREGLEVEVPGADVTVVAPRYVPGLPDEEAAFREAVRRPIGARPLCEIVKASDRVAVVIPDLLVYVYSALFAIPVVVQDWSATWENGAVALGWRLAGIAADESGSLRIQRSDEAAGPYADRVVLSLAAQMQFVDRDVEPGRAYW